LPTPRGCVAPAQGSGSQADSSRPEGPFRARRKAAARSVRFARPQRQVRCARRYSSSSTCWPMTHQRSLTAGSGRSSSSRTVQPSAAFTSACKGSGRLSRRCHTSTRSCRRPNRSSTRVGSTAKPPRIRSCIQSCSSSSPAEIRRTVGRRGGTLRTLLRRLPAGAQPIRHPGRRLLFRERRGLRRQDEEEPETVFAGELPAGTTAAERRAREINLHLVRLGAAALALPPEGIFAASEEDPFPRAGQSLARLSGGGIGR
jgi:hypothetical protein